MNSESESKWQQKGDCRSVYQTILPNTPNMYHENGIHQMTEGHRFKEQSSVIINSFFLG